MAKLSFGERLKQFFGIKKALDNEFFEDLSDLLVEGDFGAAEAYELADALKARCHKEKTSTGEEARAVLERLLYEELCLAPADDARFVSENSAGGNRSVVLLLGINGVGKTTSAAKLASFYLAQGRKPLLAACDTFRAAAIDQLKIHGERLGIRVVAHQRGGDPAAVVYDALEAARGDGCDIVIADTAGRMHTKAALVEELKKIDRVVASRSGGAVYLKYLVLDATTGRNALAQAETFHEAVQLDGVILTKADSSARGGIVFSLARSLHLPTLFIGSGEGYGDLQKFDAAAYANAFAHSS